MYLYVYVFIYIDRVLLVLVHIHVYSDTFGRQWCHKSFQTDQPTIRIDIKSFFSRRNTFYSSP